MKALTAFALLLMVSGCAVRDWCEATPEHSRICVVSTEVLVAGCVAAVAAVAVSHNTVQNHQNPPPPAQ